LYLSNTSLEDGENVEQTTVLDIPAVNPDSSGSTPLLTQLSALQQENPQDWQGEDMKELYDKLSATLNQSQALPETAKVFTKYQDALNEAPIPVNNGGYISGQAVVGDTDTNVQLEVSLDEDHYIDAETIIPSNNLTSSDVTGATLKSCPEKVFALPGEVIIIQISSTTGINLKEAGLTFSLKNPNLGCITSKPIFLEICGKKKYEKVYCLFYAKKNLTTPIDTVISAKTTTGLQLDIFTEIIKSSASISGKVFTGSKPLIKGYVKSIGPKAFCKLDSSGNYTLPRVFRGHFRKIVATYWIQENDKKIRYREEKFIDFFNSDLTNFNFGQETTPTPTSTPTATPTFPPPSDPYYDNISAEIMDQKLTWQKELGWDQGRQKTINWLNGNLSEPLLSTNISEAIQEASLDVYDPYTILFTFKNGLEVSITDPAPPQYEEKTSSQQNKTLHTKISNNNFTASSSPTTVKNEKVLMLGPNAFEDKWNKNNMFDDQNSIKTNFVDAYTKDNVTCLGIFNIKLDPNFPGDPNFPTDIVDEPSGHNNPSMADVEFTSVFFEASPTKKYGPTVVCHIEPDKINKVPRPQDFVNMDEYGVIYIRTHGIPSAIMACPYYAGDPELESWINDPVNYGKWRFGYALFSPVYSFPYSYDETKVIYYKSVMLKREFFTKSSYNNDFGGSILYLDACESWLFNDSLFGFLDPPFKNVKVYIGSENKASIKKSSKIAHDFFRYMLGMNTDNQPMNVKDAFNQSAEDNQLFYSNSKIKLYTNGGKNDNTYLPGEVTVIVHKK